jgi:hypothetical protein
MGDRLGSFLGCAQVRTNSFSEAQLKRTLRLSVLGIEQLKDGLPIGMFSRVCTSEDKSAQKRLGLVCGLVYDPRELPGVTTARPEVSGVL